MPKPTEYHIGNDEKQLVYCVCYNISKSQFSWQSLG